MQHQDNKPFLPCTTEPYNRYMYVIAGSFDGVNPSFFPSFLLSFLPPPTWDGWEDLRKGRNAHTKQASKHKHARPSVETVLISDRTQHSIQTLPPPRTPGRTNTLLLRCFNNMCVAEYSEETAKEYIRLFYITYIVAKYYCKPTTVLCTF